MSNKTTKELAPADREALELEAKEAICSCWYYYFEPEDMSNQELREIIDTGGQVIHDHYGEVCPTNKEEHDYAHCASCDKVIDLDNDTFQIIDDDTFCKDHMEENDGN